MSANLNKIISVVATWEGITIAPHRFGGLEFTLGTQEIGHILENDTLEIPFPQAIGEQLISEGKATPHPIYPHSGWVNFCICTPSQIYPALWLLKLSLQVNRMRHYRNFWTDELRRALERDLQDLRLSAAMKTLMIF